MAHALQGMVQLRGRGCWWIPGSLSSGWRHLVQCGRGSVQAHMRGKRLEHCTAGWMAWLQDLSSISGGGCRWMENDISGWPASPKGVTKQGAMMCCLFGLNHRGPRGRETQQSWLCLLSMNSLRPHGQRSGKAQQRCRGPWGREDEGNEFISQDLLCAMQLCTFTCSLFVSNTLVSMSTSSWMALGLIFPLVFYPVIQQWLPDNKPVLVFFFHIFNFISLFVSLLWTI